jgi:arylsulfate sulfotransferase
MFSRVSRRCGLGLLLILTCLLLACGSSTNTMVESPSNTTPAVVSVSISPTSSALAFGQGQTTQFTATVSGTSNTGVTWSVNGTAGGNSSVGTVNTNGVFAAPSPPVPQSGAAGVPGPGQVVTVTATSVADPTKSASASVILVSPGQVTATQNPLVAQYSFNSPVNAGVQIQFGPTTSYGLQTWLQPIPAGGGVLNMLVAGMRANTTYHMRAVVQLGGGLQYADPDQTFTTGSIPGQLPTISTSTTPGMTPNPGVELAMLFDAQPSLLATDLSGNVIWYANAPSGTIPQPAELLSNGDMLINWAAAPGEPPQSILEETDLAGNVQW